MQKTQKSLVKRLITEGVIKNMEVAHVMEQVDRKYYTSKYPYEDTPQPIGFGATISAPHMHAYALEYLYDKLKTAKYALDVGSGTGYLTAAMALITPSDCIVYGIEHVGELV
jgi:protein-L-isoaspartate(D-aspartate) O-methyltransferase